MYDNVDGFVLKAACTDLSQASRFHDVVVKSIEDLVVLVAPRVKQVNALAHGRTRARLQTELLPIIALIPLDTLQWPPRQDTLGQLPKIHE